MSVVLSINNLSKSYGSVKALNGVSFDVPQGSVFGILGPNGSGKTTLLGIVMDVRRANSGGFLWFGQPGTSPQLRQQIGSLLETPNFYSYLSAIANLKITQSISRRGNKKEIEEVLKKVNLYNRRFSLFKEFSLGMKQRLAIAAALLGDPKVLVPDEDVRVSTLPVSRGERAVLRLLDKDRGRMQLESLGMPSVTQQNFDHLLNLPHGILPVTGPTGSGKTTTLYAALSRLPRDELNIMTVEDPIEYELSGISQTQAHSRIGMDFARALRAILGQDPDVVMIGEIRDQETAQIAVQGSLTGHLVLATLRTNDAPSAVTRLIDMGIEPFLLASTLSGILAQRLVRKLCLQCRSQDDGGRWQPVGCPLCNGSGYSGRTGIYELLTVTPRLSAGIHDGLAESELRRIAQEDGMQSMIDDAARWVESGITTAEEVARATRD